MSQAPPSVQSAQPPVCPQCGAALPPDAPEGLCRACLLKRGLEANTAGYTQGARWAPPEAGDLAALFPELEMVGLIGRGGMGAVYQARQKSLDRVVALKILPPDLGHDPAFAERFAREAQALARLNHPHIVTIHEFGQRSGQWSVASGQTTGLYFFIMEFVDGTNLRTLLDAGHISPREALAIVPQICEALQYAHDQGIVHRDIKPENILLNKQGQVKIADFGLAKLMGRAGPDSPLSTSHWPLTTTAGTPQYMAPEQVEHPAEVDHRADIYSLGVVFYQMLTGELPVGRFALPSQKVQVDVRLDEVVLKALEREPEKRYQHASEVKTEVETVMQTQGSPSPGTVASPAVADMPGRDVPKEHAHRELLLPCVGLRIAFAINILAVLVSLPIIGHYASPWPLLAYLVPNIILLQRAAAMARLRSYASAVATSIGAMLAIPGNVIGLPMGIWSLMVLNRADIKAAFVDGQGAAVARPPQRARLIARRIACVAAAILLLLALFAAPDNIVKAYFTTPRAYYAVGWTHDGCQLQHSTVRTPNDLKQLLPHFQSNDISSNFPPRPLAFDVLGFKHYRYTNSPSSSTDIVQIPRWVFIVTLSIILAMTFSSWKRLPRLSTAPPHAATPETPATAAQRLALAYRIVLWTACILGGLMALLILVFMIAEGTPPLGKQSLGVQVEFAAMIMWLVGFVVGWRREGLAALLILMGSAVFHMVEGRILLGGALEIPTFIGLLYLAAWVTRPKRPAGKTPSRRLTIALSGVGVAILLLIGISPLWPRSTTPIVPKRPDAYVFPGDEASSLVIMGDDQRVYCVLHYAGRFASKPTTFASDPKTGKWYDANGFWEVGGVITLPNGREFSYLATSSPPNTLTLNTVSFDSPVPLDLMPGGVVVLHDDGHFEQLPLQPTYDQVIIRERLLRLICASTAPPTFSPAISRTLAEGESLNLDADRPNSAADLIVSRSTLSAMDMFIIVFDEQAWSDFAAEELFTRFRDDHHGATTEPRHPLDPGPRTYVFRTRDGTLGMLHYDDWFNNRAQFRYKLIGTAPAAPAVLTPETRPTQPAFGPAVERTLLDLDEDKGGQALSLATGEVLPLPAGMDPDEERIKDWLKDHAIDLMADYARNR
jgi:hypothetical protein